jgi:NRPS condensation-like uncharacterized protein
MHKEVIEGFRLSPQQRHLWLMQQDQRAPYSARCSILIEGQLERVALAAALRELVNRFEILRTTFPRHRGMNLALQAVNESSAFALDEQDWSGEGHPQAEVEARQLLEQLDQPPFELEHGPLMHVSLIKLSSSRHVLLIRLPSLCADATSLANLVEELSRAYAAVLREEELPEEPLRYADLAEWQNELLESEEREVGRLYWRKHDLSALPNIKLPFEARDAGRTTF